MSNPVGFDVEKYVEYEGIQSTIDIFDKKKNEPLSGRGSSEGFKKSRLNKAIRLSKSLVRCYYVKSPPRAQLW